MTKQEYLDKRNNLLNQAENLINSEKTDEANEIMEQIKELDDAYEKEAQARADLEALNREPKTKTPFNMEGKLDQSNEIGDISDVIKSDVYKNAWAKTMMDKSLTSEEAKAYQMVDEYVHTTGNTGAVVPTSVSNKIWELAAEMFPYISHITTTSAPGNFSMPQEDTSSDAMWYAEEAVTEDGKDTIKTFTLTGRELARDIVVSWKLKEMAIDDFINYISRKMARKMGAAADYGVIRGAGPSAEEPTGVVTALKAEEGTPQIVKYTGNPTYTDVLNARAKIASGYSTGLRVYANNTTIWTKIANILDANKRPIFMADPMTGGYRVLGNEVCEDANLRDGEILFSSAFQGYHLNKNKEITMLAQDNNTKRATVYTGYGIMDGNVTTTKAHSLLCPQE